MYGLRSQIKAISGLLVLSLIGCIATAADNGSLKSVPSRSNSSPKNCLQGDIVCVKTSLAYEAIKTLHNQLDDDNNGNVDLQESEEFLREELKYSSGQNKKRSFDHFHHDDTHITVDELWDMWIKSAVHNWTVDDVINWLTVHVELSKYEETFRKHGVDGSTLPRLSIFQTADSNFASSILGIKSIVHRQKLALKAMDVVLFGVPKHASNWLKDFLLAMVTLVAVAGLWFAYSQHRKSQEQMMRMERDYSSLREAEKNLTNMQEKLEAERKVKAMLVQDKQTMEEKRTQEMQSVKAEAEQLRAHRESTETQLTRLGLAEEELSKVRDALKKAERELELRRGEFTAGGELQKLLQISHEMEVKHHSERKAAAEAQFSSAKELCDRINRKGRTFWGSLRVGPIDEVEEKIWVAKKSMEEVIIHFTSLQNRWQAIENLCGFPIMTNPGLNSLTTADDMRSLSASMGGFDDDDLDDISFTSTVSLAARQAAISKKMGTNQNIGSIPEDPSGANRAAAGTPVFGLEDTDMTTNGSDAALAKQTVPVGVGGKQTVPVGVGGKQGSMNSRDSSDSLGQMTGSGMTASSSQCLANGRDSPDNPANPALASLRIIGTNGSTSSLPRPKASHVSHNMNKTNSSSTNAISKMARDDSSPESSESAQASSDIKKKKTGKFRFKSFLRKEKVL